VSPDYLGLSQVEFITVGTVGSPGNRTFYLQAAQGDLMVSLIIEKEHAAALSLGIEQLLEQLGTLSSIVLIPIDLTLREPLQPLFRVGSLSLGYDEEGDAVVLVARALADEEEDAPEVHFWCTQAQMYALAEHAAEVVAAGRPRCPLCDEPLDPAQDHVCARDNGRKRLFRLDE